MLKYLEMWKTGAFTEDQICESFNLDHAEFRQALVDNNLSLPMEYSYGLADEINYFTDNYTLVELCKKYHITMHRLCNNYLNRKAFHVNTSKEEIIRAELANTDLTHAEIADKLGVSRSYVSRLNLNKRRKNLTNEEWKEIEKALHSESISSVCRRYNISRTSVYYRLKK